MTPILERGAEILSLANTKFLRDGEKIIYDEPDQEHREISAKNGLGRVVDDGGYITPVGKYPYTGISFKYFTETCGIRGDWNEQRRKTVTIAKNILGDEKVSE